ncbi:protein D2-like [Oppia nitens]|uniref:protein D2-like n=1 Tax=Oppia nitens TaxID=1686743 RepID=UPI0023D9F752|nr:protein D2-like [Oppia nitens]
MISPIVHNITTVCALTAFLSSDIVPDALNTCPKSAAKVIFPTGVSAQLGNIVIPHRVREQPTITWNASDDSLYTLGMMDMDVYSRKFHIFRQELHWIVMNIPGTNVSAGDLVREFLPSLPIFGGGYHRYLFVIYKQAGRVKAPELDSCIISSFAFDWSEFVSKYQLGDPIAANFYYAKWEQVYNDSWILAHLKHLIDQCADQRKPIQTAQQEIRNIIKNLMTSY